MYRYNCYVYLCYMPSSPPSFLVVDPSRCPTRPETSEMRMATPCISAAMRCPRDRPLPAPGGSGHVSALSTSHPRCRQDRARIARRTPAKRRIAAQKPPFAPSGHPSLRPLARLAARGTTYTWSGASARPTLASRGTAWEARPGRRGTKAVEQYGRRDFQVDMDLEQCIAWQPCGDPMLCPSERQTPRSRAGTSLEQG